MDVKGSMAAGIFRRQMPPVRIVLQMVHKDSTVPYGEVEGFSTLLGYKTSNAGCCKVHSVNTVSG